MRLRKPVSIGVHLQSRANEVPGTQHLDREWRMCAFSLMGTHRSLRACARRMHQNSAPSVFYVRFKSSGEGDEGT